MSINQTTLDNLLPADEYERQRAAYMALVTRVAALTSKNPPPIVRRHIRDPDSLKQDSLVEVAAVDQHYNDLVANDPDADITDYTELILRDKKDINYLIYRLLPTLNYQNQEAIITDPNLITKLNSREDYALLVFGDAILQE